MRIFPGERATLIAMQNALRGVQMGKFIIPKTPATTNKTIRFPNDVVEQVEMAIQGKECTFSAFVIAAVRMALDDLSNDKKGDA